MNDGAVLQATSLVRTFYQGPDRIRVLEGLNLCVAPGDTIAIVGTSGSGKSTLLHALGGLDAPDSGTVCWRGTDVYRLGEADRARLRNARLGFVYQFHHLLSEFSALENVAMPLLLGGRGRRKAFAEARELLGQVGLAERVTHRPAELSGGERQRVAIARALVARPDLVMADEPTGNLDRETGQQIQSLLLELNAERNIALVVVTHDTELAAQMQRRLRLQDGRLTERPAR